MEPEYLDDDPLNHLTGSINGPSVTQSRQNNLFAEHLSMHVSFAAPVFPKTREEARFIDETLMRNNLLTNIADEERHEVVGSFEKVSALLGTELTRRGEPGDYFYIIQSGTVRVVEEEESSAQYETATMSFGYSTLMYDCPNQHSRFAQTDCILWRIERRTFRRLLAAHALRNDYRARELLRRVPFLADLDDTILNRISDTSTLVKFRKGDVIIRKGEEGHAFYIIKEGKVHVSNIGSVQSSYVDRVLGTGEYVGERALITGDATFADVTAVTNCETLCLTADDFQNVLGPLEQAIDMCMDLRNMMAVPILVNSNFEPFEWQSLATKVETVRFHANQIICQRGVQCRRALYLIRSGTICVQRDNCEARIIGKGCYFGENSLRSSSKTDFDTYESKLTIYATEDSVCRMISLSSIVDVVGPLRRVGFSSVRMSQLDLSIELEDLKKHRIIGAGTFGKVWMVTHTDTNMAFALKVLNKRDVIKKKQTKMIIREREIMEMLDHPFIIKLVNTYRDEKYLYMLTKLVQGGELFTLVRNGTLKKTQEWGAKFYSACVLEALSHMHNRNIAYRDLKTENILVDRRGYTVLADMGFAKIVIEKTFTFCGTPLYIAPEIILGRGHNKIVDHWSFGVLIYELIFGHSPFYKKGKKQMDTFKNIVNKQYKFPSKHSISDSGKDLIQRLLVVNPSNRLGSFSRADRDIKDHPWFSILSFEELVHKNISPPWVPDIRSPLDVSNYENWDHMEKPWEQTKAPIPAEQQQLFQDFDAI